MPRLAVIVAENALVMASMLAVAMPQFVNCPWEGTQPNSASGVGLRAAIQCVGFGRVRSSTPECLKLFKSSRVIHMQSRAVV